jgi:hypothetical protein
MLRFLFLCLTLVACSDARDVGLCAGEPCRTSIATEADWAAVSQTSTGARCDLVAETKYLTPATEGAALPATVYQDVKVHRFHLGFLQAVLDAFYPGINAQQYAALVQRRATRELWGGAIYQVTDAGGATLGYAFDVIVDPTVWEEQLTADDVRAVHARLSTSFSLPLAYAPTEEQAISLARSFESELAFAVYLPRGCEPAGMCEEGDRCLTVPAPVTLCGVFAEGRSVQAEHDVKVQVTMPAQTVGFPRTGIASATLFDGGSFGPDRTPLVPVGEGRYEASSYFQTLQAGDDRIEVRFDLQADQTTFEEPWITQGLYVNGTVNGSLEYDDALRLSSCTYEPLTLWHADGTLAGGDGFQLRYRHEIPFAGSGPLQLTGATVTLGGQTVTVDDYFQLVYAGVHHNWDNQFWVLFDEPLPYQGHDVFGLWVDEAEYTCCPLDGVYTLGPTLEKLDTLSVEGYSITAQ